ncbi:glycine cleavage T protein/aminomethyl transferase [Moraxella macacae 0408225]|uniref:Glycine cleavage T protein/aminomethyl transferase n=1 Tax=Moraxella macacae 0408225 TaxID=1230338 RepID=L2F9D9_9GAMM|nr:glycine cleavage system protein T [Moraxella macacae]ELA09679.1 glycine cleavage T protein/aminomethyl transferase [Moraxella macacae 0408225]
MPTFVQFLLTGNAKSADPLADSNKFLQGQITANIHKIDKDFLPTAICNLKGRILFGIWLKRANNGFYIVLSEDLADDFIKHVKKYGAFSKIELSEKTEIFPTIIDNLPTFSNDKNLQNVSDWQNLSIATGNYWITKATSELYQPQELRLHQRGGVDFDKGCYLGQEIIARLWFKASPKAWLHRIFCQDLNQLSEKIGVVNHIQINHGFEALVVARPDELHNITQNIPEVKILTLPEALQQSVARKS